MRPDWDAREDEPIFKMEIVLPRWSAASDRLKHSIVDHELRRLQTNSKGNSIVVTHTLEEFPEIIERWGFYLEDRRHFAEICAAALQRERAGSSPAGELVRKGATDQTRAWGPRYSTGYSGLQLNQSLSFPQTAVPQAPHASHGRTP